MTERLKDEVLNELADQWNVAAFASFGPSLELRYLRLPEHGAATSDLDSVVANMLRALGSLNVRSFAPQVKSGPFAYGLETVSDVVEQVRRNGASGLYSIVNETIDIHDGGVSGVSLGGIAEFAPDHTPRTVEGGDNANLSVPLAQAVLRRVYGDSVEIPTATNRRIEFSVHPRGVGTRRGHVLVWESEAVSSISLHAQNSWPNRFSQLLGDKTFGLLLADALGACVPHTVVVGRRVAPFVFGRECGTGAKWLRTAPKVQTPGHFTSTPYWQDPYALLAKEDPDGEVAAVLSQSAVPARFSGASSYSASGEPIVEGVAGSGELFMLGSMAPSVLPEAIKEDVRRQIEALRSSITDVTLEWAHDGERVWVLQVHAGGVALESGVLSPGEANEWKTFDVADGIEEIRRLARELQGRDIGVLIRGSVGVTSHIGDILRQARVPARLAPAES